MLAIGCMILKRIMRILSKPIFHESFKVGRHGAEHNEDKTAYPHIAVDAAKLLLFEKLTIQF